MNTHIGDKIFQETPRRVAKFCKNRPRDVEKSVVGKKIKQHDQNITVFAIANAIAGDCNYYYYCRFTTIIQDNFISPT